MQTTTVSKPKSVFVFFEAMNLSQTLGMWNKDKDAWIRFKNLKANILLNGFMVTQHPPEIPLDVLSKIIVYINNAKDISDLDHVIKGTHHLDFVLVLPKSNRHNIFNLRSKKESDKVQNLGQFMVAKVEDGLITYEEVFILYKILDTFVC